MATKCPCGCDRGYADATTEAAIQNFVDTLGPTVRVVTPDGTWLVPRHYIALHGIAAVELPQLAAQHGWRRVLL